MHTRRNALLAGSSLLFGLHRVSARAEGANETYPADDDVSIDESGPLRLDSVTPGLSPNRPPTPRSFREFNALTSEFSRGLRLSPGFGAPITGDVLRQLDAFSRHTALIERSTGPGGLNERLVRGALGREVVDVAARRDLDPDVIHLGDAVAPPTVTVTLDAFRTLFALNSFVVPRGKMIFGVRGGTPISAPGLESLALRGTMPDHRDQRCTIGVIDWDTGTIRAYRGSTVPNVAAMAKQRGAALGKANRMVTGLYHYEVGTHNLRAEGEKWLPGCLRPSPADILCLRVLDDAPHFSLDAVLDLCQPGNNIHPAYSRTISPRGSLSFNSAGCQVLDATVLRDPFRFGSSWIEFRDTLGLRPYDDIIGKNSPDDGRVFPYLLVSYSELALHATTSTTDRQGLRTLRMGSRDMAGQTPAVANLQRALSRRGIQVRTDGIFTAETGFALAKFQASFGGSLHCTGMATRADLVALGLI